MIIDFHTHIFPDEIAERAIFSLAERSGLEPQTNGTVSDTLCKMNQWGIDKAVCLNIATKPHQQKKINSFMEKTACERLIPFGTLHPDSTDSIEEILAIKNMGFKGIKLHPDYQNFYADDEKMNEIYSALSELSLSVIFHSGYDIGLGCPIHCTPYMIKKISETFPNLTIIAAHFGGYGMWKDACELLEKFDNVYFDTAFSLGLDKGIAEKIINRKGAEKIVLGSDCPWECPKYSVEFIDSLNISSSEKELIFHKNAERILKI